MDYEGVDDRAVEAHPEQTLPEETVDHVSDPCGNDPRGPVRHPRHLLLDLLASLY
jgi:hypothetical protein